MTSIKYAISQETGKPMSIRNAKNGLSCNCFCAECGKEMVANQGKVYDWYFDHHIQNDTCGGGLETILHRRAKYFLAEGDSIKLPKYGVVKYTDAMVERDFMGYKPDVTAFYDDKAIFFEIAVNHFMDYDKRSFFSQRFHRCVEIDLSTIPYDVSDEDLKRILFLESTNKTIVAWNKPEIVLTQEKPISTWEKLFVFIEKNPLISILLTYCLYRVWRKAPIFAAIVSFLGILFLSELTTRKTTVIKV